MDDLKELTTENGLTESIDSDLSFENLPDSMKEEFEDGKGGED